MALDRPITDIVKTDLDNLIADQVPEGITLEYKESLSLYKPEEKKEFVRDITAFANTRGGHIVYGISEDRNKGIPKELCGIPIANQDKLKQCLENLIRDGTNPRIYGMQIGNPIAVDSDKFAVVIKIPHSFNTPHMVICGGDDRFYYRTNAGRARLEVTGLRTLFEMADTIVARTQAFRAERLSKIQSGDTPVPLASGPKCVLHLVPFDAFTIHAHYDLSRLAAHPEELANAGRWRAPSGFERSRYNFDGLVTYQPIYDETQPREWYTQCFRNGIIEAVNMEYNSKRTHKEESSVGIEYECNVSSSVSRYLKIQRDMGVVPPVFVLLTLLEMKGCKLSRRDADSPGIKRDLNGDPFKQDDLVLPEVVIEDFDCDISKQMEPIFEIAWNAAGLSKKNNSQVRE
jgi:hypothetical protein